MKYRETAVAVALILLIIASSSYQRAYTASASLATPKARTPIQHIVIIMQENHAFDNQFGVFPGIPKGFALNLNICIPYKISASVPCIKPWNADKLSSAIQSQDLPHTHVAALEDYNNGKMNGFVAKAPACCKNYTMAYYTGKTLPYWWDFAQYYTLDYDFMQSALGHSLPNHLFAVAAQARCVNDCQTTYNLTYAQVGQSLTQAGLSWGYYQYNWNDSIDCIWPNVYNTSFIAHNTRGGWDSFWTGLADFLQVQSNPTECADLQNFHDLENAISTNTLPNVSWIIPSPQVSNHPGQSTWQNSQEYLASVIDAIEGSPAWSSTVIFLTEDEWGGYYDGVVPLQLDSAGEGFRVPLIAISPYSIHGGILRAPAYNYGSEFKGIHQEDFSAFLSTIEYNWRLGNLTDRDGYEPNLFFMLNFSQAPLPPLILGSSGVSYPYTTCPPSACMIGVNGNEQQGVQFFQPTNSSLNESLSQALAYSGNGDPSD